MNYILFIIMLSIPEYTFSKTQSVLYVYIYIYIQWNLFTQLML